MSNETPNLPCGHHHSMLIKSVESDYTACELCDIRSQRNDAIEMERKYRVENARLREEVEMLNVRHAAAMLHAQTHADEYNALREDEKGLLQDIQRLTEEAFKRDEELALTTGTLESRERNIATLQEELAEAKRDTGLAKLVIQQKQDQIASAEAALEQAEARALANEKDAAVAKFGATCFAEHRDEMSDLDGGWLHEKALECGLIYGKEVTAEMWDGCGSVHCECEVGDICYFPTDAGKAAISGAKHEG